MYRQFQAIYMFIILFVQILYLPDMKTNKALSSD